MHFPLAKEQPKGSLVPFSQTTSAWLVICGFVLLSAAAIFAGAGSVYRYIFPLLAAAVGLFLYARYPVLYVGFTWWLWMVTPFVARLADYYGSWDPKRVMMLAPFLVTLLPFLTLMKRLPQLARHGAAPFIVSGSALLYGTVVGLVNNSAFGVARSLLDWLTPLIFGLYFFVNWRSYPQYKQNIQRVFLWGVLLIGTYAIYQYLVAPPWDRFWLEQTGLTSMGSPVPRGLRIWATMNSPGPFSSFISVGLLLLLGQTSPLTIPALGTGFLSLLLTLVRTAWGTWLIGVSLLFSSLKPNLQMRLLFSFILVALMGGYLATLPQFSDSIGERLSTLTDIGSDGSFNARVSIFQTSIDEALFSLIGQGLGSLWVVKGGATVQAVVDNGIIDTLRTLGWVGTVPYFAGFLMAISGVLRSTYARSDLFLATARAVSVSFCCQMVMGTAVAGFPGLIIWGFLGLGLAGDKYHRRHDAELLAQKMEAVI